MLYLLYRVSIVGLRGATTSLILVLRSPLSLHMNSPDASRIFIVTQPHAQSSTTSKLPLLRPTLLEVPSRPQTSACIAISKPGRSNLDPEDLKRYIRNVP